MKDLTRIIQKLGLSEKAATLYLACLRLGEATVLDLARHAKVKRTTIYYVLEELRENGALIETKRNKKVYYVAVEPRALLKRTRDRLSEFEDSLDELERTKHAVYRKPRLYFLYGPQGFKRIWDMIFASETKEFRIITAGESFLDFVKEKYILDEIITTKKKLGIFSRQLISDSPYARKIVAKDVRENRVSKILPPQYKLPFTEVICDEFVAFISPRWDNTLFIVENEQFAMTRKSMFEMMWQKM
jgi:sugar-specific transcriptional regulator TrmB